MAVCFKPGYELTRNDLSIFLVNEYGVPVNAAEISYAIYFVDKSKGDSGPEILIGPAERTPVNPSVGEYYAALLVPPGAAAGLYRIRWKFKKTVDGEEQEVVQEFGVHREDGPAVEDGDYKEWWFDGLRHREGGPAVEFSNGRKEWFRFHKRHREDGPAVEDPDGTTEWWVNGFRHREDGPAFISKDGAEHWFLKGKRHREGGPAVVSPNGDVEYWCDDKRVYDPGTIHYGDGHTESRICGVLHREDGPALTIKGLHVWYAHGRVHRDHAPAVYVANGACSEVVCLESDAGMIEVLVQTGDTLWVKNGMLHREDGPAVMRADGSMEWWEHGRLLSTSKPPKAWLKRAAHDAWVKAKWDMVVASLGVPEGMLRPLVKASLALVIHRLAESSSARFRAEQAFQLALVEAGFDVVRALGEALTSDPELVQELVDVVEEDSL